MDNVLYLYKVVDGKYEPFPNKIGNDDNAIYDFVYNAKRMGGAPTITCTYKHPMCLDDLWSENVIAEFRGDKFFIRKTPTSSYDNTESVYKHELTLVSERIVLENVYFFDVVSDNNGDYQPITNSTNIPFFGTIYDLAKRLDYSLRYSGLQEVDDFGNVTDGYYIVVDGYDESVKHLYTEGKLITAQDQFFLNVLQECYNTFEIPYYFDGKTIHIGFGGLGEEIREQDGSAFQYGIDHSLLSIKKQNTNNKVVNRITGVGSADNIPYYYPNETEKGQISLSFVGALKKEDVVSINKQKLSSTTDFDSAIEFEVISFQANGDEDITYLENEFGSYKSATSEQPTSSNIDASRIWGNRTLYAKNYKYKETKDAHVWSFNIRANVTGTENGRLSLESRIYYVATVEGHYKDFYAKHLQQETKCYIEDKETDEFREVDIDVVLSETYVALIKIDAGEFKKGETKRVELRFDFRLNNNEATYLKEDSLSTIYCAVKFDFGKTIGTVCQWKGSRLTSENISDFGITLKDDVLQRISDSPQDFVGTSFKVVRDSYIYPQGNLMPYIYRDSGGTNRFYNALNETYTDADGNYIYYPNPYVEGRPSEHIENFDDIKPTIKGMVGEEGQAFDSFIEFAFDENDNDETDENGKYIHPYFFAKLPKYNGEYGFNLFDHAIDESEMTISMTSGSCGSCEFVIGVDADSQKNLVQVNGNGILCRDTDGNVRCGREGMQKEEPQDAQNDTMNNEVWIALKKDASTFGVLMPNAEHKYYPKVGDTFVILHIDLPKAYIEAAEKRLEDALLAYMQENNEEKFSFSMQMSRIFLAQNPIIRDSINENSKVLVSYNGKEYSLFISSYQYKVTSKDALPDITLELKDELSINKNAIENAVGQVKTELLGKLNSVNFISQGSTTFLRKDIDDVAHGKITFEQGLKSNDKLELGKFVEGASGAGIWKDVYGNWHIESDFFNVRKKLSATSVEIKESHHIGGEIMLTAASCTIDYVRVVENEDGVNVYRCYFLKQDADGNTITNDWFVGDQAMCQFFNVTSVDSLENRYYWRVVKDTSNEKTITPELIEFEDAIINTINYHYIDLAFEGESEVYGSDAPRALDKVVQLGYRGDEKENINRKNAIIISGAGVGSPYIRQYTGINNFDLGSHLDTQIKPNENILSGNTMFVYNKQDETEDKTLNDLGQGIDDANKNASDAKNAADEANKNANQAIGDAENAKSLAEQAINTANTTINDVRDELGKLEYGKHNMLLNSGFTGDYVTASLNNKTNLNENTEMYSPSLKHWEYNNDNVKAQESEESQSGAEVSINATYSIVQTMPQKVRMGQNYIFSCRGKGGVVSISVGGVNFDLPLSNAWDRYIQKFTATSDGAIISIYATNPCQLCELQLEEGTIASAWGMSPLDNRSELARYEQLTYLQNILLSETTINGGMVSTGVVNSGLISMGHFNENGEMERVTAGLSGTHNNDNDPAFFAGGDLAQAIYTISAYQDNPNYQPTQEELDNMAKVVITHGGRAILNDIILRGYIYALGGKFNGDIIAKGGKIGGFNITENDMRLGDVDSGVGASEESGVTTQIKPGISWFQNNTGYNGTTIERCLVGIGFGANPLFSDFAWETNHAGTGVYVYKNQRGGSSSPCAEFINDTSDNENANIATFSKGLVVNAQGHVSVAKEMNITKEGDTNTIDLRFGSSFLISNTISFISV